MLKILVDSAQIQQAQAEYDKLAGKLTEWRAKYEANDISLLKENSGNYQDKFHEKSMSFTTGTLEELENQVLVTGTVLEEAHRKAKGLIARSIDFVSILRGDEELGDAEYEVADTSGITVLKFEDTYCREDSGFAGKIKDDSEEVETLSKKESVVLENISAVLSQLQTINVDISAQKAVIDNCIIKQKRVVPLYNSLVSYGQGVKSLNSYVSSTLRANCSKRLVGVGRNYKNMSLNTPYLMDPLLALAIARELKIKLGELLSFLRGYIPQNWDNDTIVAVMNKLNTGVPLPYIFKHEENNEGEISSVYTPGTYIENQSDWGNLLYGCKTMADSGCGIIAVINALHSMGYDLTEDEAVALIGDFEVWGAVWYATFGTSPQAIEQYLIDKTDYTVSTTTSDDYGEIQDFAEDNDTLIVLVYNDENDVTVGLHYMNIEIVEKPDGTKKYVVHNGSNTKEYDSVQQAIEEGYDQDAKVVETIGLKNP